MPIPQSDLAAFIAKYSTPYDPATDTYRRPPFASPTKAGKATAIYNAHSYHTKVPPQGVEPYIKHYTEPGDLVLDPFCGSGMTGVAALKQGRRVILNDLSPAAAHIAYNYCTPVDVEALKREFERIKLVIKDEFDWLYGTTCDKCGGPAMIHYVLWADVVECDRCGTELHLWRIAMDKDKGEVQDEFTCPSCQKKHSGRVLRWLRSEPVLTSYECSVCKPKRKEHPTTQAEIAKIRDVESKPIPYWFPTSQFDDSFEMWRGVHRNQGITDASRFYSYRNLWGLALLWQCIQPVNDLSVRGKLEFAFTSMAVKLASRMSNVSFRGPNKINLAGQLPGTLYIPALMAERNVNLLFEDKTEDVISYGRNISARFDSQSLAVSINSAAEIFAIPNNCVDYVFTDPPFGSNLFYADLNFLWEAWLNSGLTNQVHEAVVHLKHKNKNTLSDYARLMTGAFREMHRVLKPGRWASVVFHNSDDKIWQTILDAAQTAGLELAEINIFDKEQLTFKGRKGASGVERVTNKDIVLNLHKPAPNTARGANGASVSRNGDAEVRVVQRIADHLATSPNADERTLQHFWNAVLHEMLVNGVVEVSMEQVGKMLPYYFKDVDGRWYLRGEAVMGGNAFDLKTDAGSIAWLSAVLTTPRTVGELIPQWQAETAQVSDADPGRLERLLEQNFWLDKKTGRWRQPTNEERERMMATQDIAAEAHLRVIRRFLAGQSDHRPSSREVAAWVQFAYNRGAYPEAVALYTHVDESQLESEYIEKLRKIIAVCRMKAGQTGRESD